MRAEKTPIHDPWVRPSPPYRRWRILGSALVKRRWLKIKRQSATVPLQNMDEHTASVLRPRSTPTIFCTPTPFAKWGVSFVTLYQKKLSLMLTYITISVIMYIVVDIIKKGRRNGHKAERTSCPLTSGSTEGINGSWKPYPYGKAKEKDFNGRYGATG